VEDNKHLNNKGQVKTHSRTQRQVQAVGKTISRPEGHLGEI
jgi:hypothetical protein